MEFNNFLQIVKPYTMTSVERIKTLYESMEYVRLNNIDGDIVECGVWKGGNILGCIEYCKFYNISKKFWLYDTFSGMTESSEYDFDIDGTSGRVWQGKCNSPLEEVKKIIQNTKYPNEYIRYIIGDICETLNIVDNIPVDICILRLDTDWYQSTKKELEILYPKLINKGVLIVDDYGHWNGAKKAVDEYFGNNTIIEKIDYTGIKIIKN